MCKDLREYHSVTVDKCGCGEQRVRHARMDIKTHRLVWEQMQPVLPLDDDPFAWEEILLIAAAELLERREMERGGLS